MKTWKVKFVVSSLFPKRSSSLRLPLSVLSAVVGFRHSHRASQGRFTTLAGEVKSISGFVNLVEDERSTVTTVHNAEEPVWDQENLVFTVVDRLKY